MFNRVELWGVRWKEDEGDARFLSSRKQVRLAVEGSIVHHNHATFLHGWKKLADKPKFKQGTVHRAIVSHRRIYAAIHLSCNNSTSLVLAAADSAEYHTELGEAVGGRREFRKEAAASQLQKSQSGKLIAYVKRHPDAYQKEIAEAFGCSATAIYLAMKRLKITRKTRQRYTESRTRKK